MASRETMIKLRLDVDYAYPSRMKSFLLTVLNRKTNKNYLRNAKVIAKMINESPRKVKAFWFFTPQTIPDSVLLGLLTPDKHEVALHVAKNPYAELEKLEKATNRKTKFYTIHGTARLLARLMWRRRIWEARATIPEGFPLQSFYEFPTLDFDFICHRNSPERAFEVGAKSIAKGEVLHVHPEWLFKHGTINPRGPFYEPLRRILRVDGELELLVTRKKGFAKIACYGGTLEYQRDFIPKERFLEKLEERGVDVFTFIERKWCCTIPNLPKSWVKTEDNIALLNVTTYEDWLKLVGKKTRNMIRKAEKSGIQVQVAQPSENLAEGIWKIYNETPIRQERAFPHYGISLDAVKANVLSSTKDTFIAAFFQKELAGFIQLVHGDREAIISQILSLRKHSDKAVNNALIAKAVEVCAQRQTEWLMYGRIGNHPSLDTFKQNNGFKKFSLPRYYVPITRKGRLAIQLGLHRELKDAAPERIKPVLIPIFNWVSRIKQRLRRSLSSTQQSRISA
jgi:hypothetical protein